MDKRSKENVEQSLSSIKDLLQVAPMLLHIERQVISILVVKGLVRVTPRTNDTDDYTFDNIELTDYAYELISGNEDLKDAEDLLNLITSKANRDQLIKATISSVSDEEVYAFRMIFPAGSRGPGKAPVRARLERFLNENECSLEEIMKAAQLYIKHNTSKGYNIQAAHYFLYKRDMGTRIEESKCEEYLEQLRTGKEVKDWRDETV